MSWSVELRHIIHSCCKTALFILRGPSFQFQIQIPITSFRPETNTLHFFLEAPDVLLDLSLPRWSTHALHIPKEGINVWKAAFIRLDGIFHFSPEVCQDFVEQLRIQISVRSPLSSLLLFSHAQSNRHATSHSMFSVGPLDISWSSATTISGHSHISRHCPNTSTRRGGVCLLVIP